MVRYVVLTLFVIVVSSTVASQTIHEDDLDYFVGAFAVVDSSGQTHVDGSKFVDWFLLMPDSAGMRTFREYAFSPDRLWVYDWYALTEQSGEMRWRHRPQYRDSEQVTYRYYIMQDYGGWELQRNVLTIWKPVGCDSLQYVCGQTDDFDTSIGHASVKLMTVFPDGSLLMVVDQSGEIRGAYGFYRGTSPCNFERFYLYTWFTGDEADTVSERATFDLRSLTDVSSRDYHVYVHNEFLRRPDLHRETIDSVTYQAFDLWRLAKEHFGIDSTGAAREN